MKLSQQLEEKFREYREKYPKKLQMSFAKIHALKLQREQQIKLEAERREQRRLDAEKIQFNLLEKEKQDKLIKIYQEEKRRQELERLRLYMENVNAEEKLNR